MSARKICKCGKPSVPGLVSGVALCRYHYNVRAFGQSWADKCADQEGRESARTLLLAELGAKCLEILSRKDALDHWRTITTHAAADFHADQERWPTSGRRPHPIYQVLQGIDDLPDAARSLGLIGDAAAEGGGER